MTQTLINASEALNAIQDVQQIYTNYQLLSEAFAVPVTLSATDTAYITNRLAAMLAFAGNTNQFNVTALTPSYGFTQNIVPVASPGYLAYVLNFVGESVPNSINNAVLTTSSGTVITDSSGNPINLYNVTQTIAQAALDAANAWLHLAQALAASGLAYNQAAYNAVIQMYDSSLAVYQNINAGSFTFLESALIAWNNLVSTPSILTMASLTGNDPTSLQSQSVNAAKYALGTTLQNLNQVLITLREQVSGNIQLVTVKQNQNLMDIASQSLGNFELWNSLATTNNLLPPYTQSTPGANVASPGQQLFLPTSGSTITQGTTVSYTINYLGTDIYYGPLNQDMLPWTGDFQVISGYDNLAFSLGRRLQTSIGDLIYHPTFGSRLPPEVGSITVPNQLAYLQAYATSAVLSDPRVNSVISANATQYTNYAIGITVTVLPNGLNSKSVSVNEVLGPTL